MPEPSKPRRKGKRLNATMAAAAEGVTVPVRWVKFFIGLFLLPVCYVLTLTFFNVLFRAFASSHADSPGFWITPQFWFFSLGLICWLVVYFGLPKWLTIYVFGHELTHALVVSFMGGHVSDFDATRDGGHIVSNKINTWIALAPYFIPIYSVFVIILYGLASVFFDLEPHRDLALGVLFFALGFTWGFHACFTISMIPKGQSDLHYGGTFFSLTFIYLMNLLVLAILLVVATPHVTFVGFARELFVQASAFSAQVVQFLALLARSLQRV